MEGFQAGDLKDFCANSFATLCIKDVSYTRSFERRLLVELALNELYAG